MRRVRIVCTTVVAVIVSIASLALFSESELNEPAEPLHGRRAASYGRLPLTFEVNRGQAANSVTHLARARGRAVLLGPTDVTLSEDSAQTHRQVGASNPLLRMRLAGANPRPSVRAHDEQPGTVNYLLGSDPKEWHIGLPTFAKVVYEDVYPGVDVAYYGNTENQLEFDFVVAPGADPGAIALDFRTANGDEASVDTSGALLFATAAGDLRVEAPVAYQDNPDGTRDAVPARYTVDVNSMDVRFELGDYDTSRALVIDPVLSYSTFLNTTAGANDVVVDAAGNTFIAGAGFVAKVDPTGSNRLFVTYLPANLVAITLDSAGFPYVTGYTGDPTYPTTPGAVQPAIVARMDGVASKLTPTGGAPVYSTFLGGSWFEFGRSIGVDASGNAVVAITGGVAVGGFPVTAGAFQTSVSCCGDHAAIVKLNPTGTAMIYSTYLGGSNVDGVEAVAVDAAGRAYIAGWTGSANFPTTVGAYRTTHNNPGFRDAYVTVLNAAGNGLVYSTFLGGTGPDMARGIALDPAGNAIVVGWTSSADFPTTAGAVQPLLRGPQNIFVSRLNASGSALTSSTYLGGNALDYAMDVALDRAGIAWVAAQSTSSDFPTTAGALQTIYGGSDDAVVAAINAAGTSLVYSTYLGGSAFDSAMGVAVDGPGNVYAAGASQSTTFPTTPGGYMTSLTTPEDAFVLKLGTDVDPPAITCEAADGLWHSANVTLNCTAEDSGSGLADPADASLTLSTSVAVGTETATASTNSRSVCDNAGHCATAGPIGGNQIDRKAPTITLTTPSATNYLLGQAVNAVYSCADGGSGVAGCAGPTASGSPIDTSSVGSHTFAVNATDAVGNTDSVSRSYGVAFGQCLLYDNTKAHKSGSTIPIKLQLCDAAGANVSSASTALVATSVYLVSNNAPGPLEDSGAANPDFQFRFDVDKYIFNLSLKGFSQGTYALTFTAAGDPTAHVVTFQVK